jgi:hypothetical protein
MKKIFILFTSITLLAGCAETMALLGPASSLVAGGNIVNSSISSVASYSVKKATGKSPMQHALSYAQEKNPNKKKDRCLSFVKETESEACYIAKKQISSATRSTSKKIKSYISSEKTKIDKSIKTKQKSSLPIEIKKETQVKENKSNFKIKTEEKVKLKSVESMFVESVLNKKQISHLSVSIKKNSSIKASSK